MSAAKPMDPNQRVLRYLRNTDRWDTPRQTRRRKHKLGHLAALERRVGVGNVELASTAKGKDQS